MKKENNFLMLIALVFAISISPSVNGQGRGHHKGHEKNHGHNSSDRDHRDRDHHDRDHRYHGNDRREVRHVYHYHDRHCNDTPVVHHYQRPRYIYYRDYDVYYDCRTNVYISYSGRSWIVSTRIPFVMQHINLRRASRFEVDYYEDGFPQYLERRRPTYSREYRDW